MKNASAFLKPEDRYLPGLPDWHSSHNHGALDWVVGMTDQF
jgi:hypothetical protein